MSWTRQMVTLKVYVLLVNQEEKKGNHKEGQSLSAPVELEQGCFVAPLLVQKYCHGKGEKCEEMVVEKEKNGCGEEVAIEEGNVLF
ncbi:hypothetical protein Tco_0060032 [Tanacetum coccineum]